MDLVFVGRVLVAGALKLGLLIAFGVVEGLSTAGTVVNEFELVVVHFEDLLSNLFHDLLLVTAQVYHAIFLLDCLVTHNTLESDGVLCCEFSLLFTHAFVSMTQAFLFLFHVAQVHRHLRHEETLVVKAGVKPGLLLDDVMEHIKVDITDRLHQLPGHLSVGNSEVGFLYRLKLSELESVSIAGVEDDLDLVDALAPLYPKLKTIPEVNEILSTEQSQGRNPQLTGNDASDHYNTPCSPTSRATAALLLASVVWV